MIDATSAGALALLTENMLKTVLARYPQIVSGAQIAGPSLEFTRTVLEILNAGRVSLREDDVQRLAAVLLPVARACLQKVPTCPLANGNHRGAHQVTTDFILNEHGIQDVDQRSRLSALLSLVG